MAESVKKILIVVGTRPNFIKVTQMKRVAEGIDNVDIHIVHTGQHYDSKMSQVFFDQFGLVPDSFLNIPQASANTQMGEIMIRLEKVVNEVKPDLMMVVGDVNSTCAAAITANKMGIRIAHLESGLRSRDRGMPEEINRLLADEITDDFFITEQSGWDNLIAEGKNEEQLHFVGNTMIDTMVAFEENIQASPILSKLGVEKDGFVLMTIHRPATVDFEPELDKLADLIDELTKRYKVVFPIHPRTVKRLEDFGLKHRYDNNDRLILTEPMDYFAFQKLVADSKLILTDSGGIQEETTFRQVPCLTLRPNTERPSTLEIGTNTLVTFDIASILNYVKEIEDGTYKKGIVPPLWDGKATDRILQKLSEIL